MEPILIHLANEEFKLELDFYDEYHKDKFIGNVDKIKVISYDKYLDENIVKGKLNGALDNMQSDNLNLNILPFGKKGLSDLENSIDLTKKKIKYLGMKSRHNIFDKDYWNFRKFVEIDLGGQFVYDLAFVGGIFGTMFTGQIYWLVPSIFASGVEGIALNGVSVHKDYLKGYENDKQRYLDFSKKMDNLDIEIVHSDEAEKIIKNVEELTYTWGDLAFVAYDKVNDRLREVYSKLI